MKQMYALLGLLVLLGYAPVEALANQPIGQQVTTPILSVTPQSGEFGGVLLGYSGTVDFTIRNTGTSDLNIKKLEVVGSNFILSDYTIYPFEVFPDTSSANHPGNSGRYLKFSVFFIPTDTGVKTGKVVITYGPNSDETYEIPLTGEGISCRAATVATKGENWAPHQNIWFKYTADKFSLVDINSCHPHQQPVGRDQWELFLYLYSDCCGTLLAGGNEPNGTCVYNSTAVSQMITMEAGETIYIFWPLASLTAPSAKEGFYFNINVTYPVDGDVCENAIPLTLPVINLFGNTRGLNDDYNYSPCSPISNYMDGNDKVYTITLPGEGYLIGNILGAYGSIHVLDECPKTELTIDHCKAFAGGPNGGHFRKKIDAGTYYVIISNWSPPQTLDFLLNLNWEGVSGVENDNLMSDLVVYPNPTHDKFTIGINNDAPTDLTLELVTMSGQTVYRNEVKAVYSLNHEIDVSQYARGVYYLKVNNGKELKIRKVLIE